MSPPRHLSPWIACLWEIQGDPGEGSAWAHRVLPDGCADLLFDLEASRYGSEHGELVGPMNRAIVAELRGKVALLGVRLKPGVVGAFAGIPADRLADKIAPTQELPSTLRLSAARLAALPTFAARSGLLSVAIQARLAELDSSPDELIRRAISRWVTAEAGGFAPVAVLARDLGLSERAFERRFASQVGLTPVRFRRLARLRSVLRLFASGLKDWAALAAATGFSDQAHLVRDYQQLVGLSPLRWAATQAPGAGFLQDGRISAI
jgi:AraC-like DNA-binding protein